VTHQLKTTLDDDRKYLYAIGTYDAEADKWTLDDTAIDVGIGLRYNYDKSTFMTPWGGGACSRRGSGSPTASAPTSSRVVVPPGNNNAQPFVSVHFIFGISMYLLQ
jgi:hypothetical protein